MLRQLATFLGHDDARRLSADDLIGWKTTMIEAGLRPKTIRDAKITPVRAILQWAADNRHLAANPTERIVIGVKTKNRRDEARLHGRGGQDHPESGASGDPSGAALGAVAGLRDEGQVTKALVVGRRHG